MITGKNMMEVANDDVRWAAGNFHVCAGHQAECEAAIHSMRRIYYMKISECETALTANVMLSTP